MLHKDNSFIVINEWKLEVNLLNYIHNIFVLLKMFHVSPDWTNYLLIM